MSETGSKSGNGGTMEGDRGDAKAQPSGPLGDNPGTAGQGETKVSSTTPEGAEGKINPSAPGDTGTSEKERA
jgi:hypothetical protein